MLLASIKTGILKLFFSGILSLSLVGFSSDHLSLDNFQNHTRARTFKCLWGPGIDAKELIPPAYVVWRAGTKTLFLLGA